MGRAILAAFKHIPSNFEKIAAQMVVMAIRYSLICSFRTGALEIRYADVAHQIASETLKRAGATFRALRDIYPSDETFRTAFETKEVKTAKHARFLLQKLEVFDTGSAFDPTSDTRSVNLEHIVPKEKNRAWSDIGDLHDEEYDHWVYLLGNQVLLDTKTNKEIGRSSFSEKKLRLRESPYELTKSVARKKQWSTAEITKRQRELAKLAVDCWKYEM